MARQILFDEERINFFKEKKVRAFFLSFSLFLFSLLSFLFLFFLFSLLIEFTVVRTLQLTWRLTSPRAPDS